MTIRKLFLVLILVFSIGTLQAAQVGDKAPSFKVEDVNGKVVDLASFKGKKAVWLVFWATWCPNCEEEIPALKKLYEKYSDKVELIAVNVGVNDSVKRTKRYIKKHDLPYTVVFSNNIAKDYRIMGTPTQVVVDINGNVSFISTDVPHNLTADDIEGLLKK
jgi:peroxiredoxin